MTTKTAETKVTGYKAEFIEKELVLPTTCPECNADLSEPGTIREWYWSDELTDGHIHKDEWTYDNDGDHSHGDENYPFLFMCKACEHHLAEA